MALYNILISMIRATKSIIGSRDIISLKYTTIMYMPSGVSDLIHYSVESIIENLTNDRHKAATYVSLLSSLAISLFYLLSGINFLDFCTKFWQIFYYESNYDSLWMIEICMKSHLVKYNLQQITTKVRLTSD
jgi:hypothetical protein